MIEKIQCDSFELDPLSYQLTLMPIARVRSNAEFKAARQIMYWLEAQSIHVFTVDITRAQYVDSAVKAMMQNIIANLASKTFVTVILRCKEQEFIQNQMFEEARSVYPQLNVEFEIPLIKA